MGGGKADEGILGVVQHGEVDQPCGVVLIEVNPQVAFDTPIVLNCIEFTQYLHEVFGVLFADILEAKIINVEGERDGTPSMRAKSRGECGLFFITLFVEPLL